MEEASFPPVPWDEAIGWIRPSAGAYYTELIDTLVLVASLGCFGDDRDQPTEAINCENIEIAGRLIAARRYREYLLSLSDEALMAESAKMLTKQDSDRRRDTVWKDREFRARMRKAGQKGGARRKRSDEILSAIKRISADPNIGCKAAWSIITGNKNGDRFQAGDGKTIAYGTFRQKYWPLRRQ
jgi:hypothetical protein